MRRVLQFVATLIVTFVVMFAFRALAFTIFSVPYKGLEPTLRQGDHVLVNRWSYGLRTGGGSVFPYARWMRDRVCNGDVVAFNSPLDSGRAIDRKPVLICRCEAGPGDTVWINHCTPIIIPGKCRMIRVDKSNVRLLCNTYRIHEHKKATVVNDTLFVDGKETHCASFSRNYYWMQSVSRNNLNDSRYFGLVPDELIIGRVMLVLYSKDSKMPFYDGYDSKRILKDVR